jgi:hypothetical protein
MARNSSTRLSEIAPYLKLPSVSTLQLFPSTVTTDTQAILAEEEDVEAAAATDFEQKVQQQRDEAVAAGMNKTVSFGDFLESNPEAEEDENTLSLSTLSPTTLCSLRCTAAFTALLHFTCGATRLG